jgi:hypothetical protein
MANPQLQRLADSAALKVLQYVVTVIMVPAFMWYGGKVLDRLDRLESLMAQANTDRATFELRLRALEAQGPTRDTQLAKFADSLMRHELDIQRLKDGKR